MNDVELERQKLIEQKRTGEYDLFEHLDNHPVAGLVKMGARLPDEHPLSKLKSIKEQREYNFMFSGIDWSKVVAIAPDGKKYKHPTK